MRHAQWPKRFEISVYDNVEIIVNPFKVLALRNLLCLTTINYGYPRVVYDKEPVIPPGLDDIQLASQTTLPNKLSLTDVIPNVIAKPKILIRCRPVTSILKAIVWIYNRIRCCPFEPNRTIKLTIIMVANLIIGIQGLFFRSNPLVRMRVPRKINCLSVASTKTIFNWIMRCTDKALRSLLCVYPCGFVAFLEQRCLLNLV